MDRIFAGNKPLIDYVVSVLGHCLTGDISLEYFWVCFGSGANGKSTLLAIIQYIMGEYSGSAPDSLLTDGRDEHPTELADLQGRRLVIASETENNARLKLQLVKRLTGEPTIKARRMRQDFYEFGRTHKMIMQTNNKPRVREDSEAAWRRIKLIPFAVQIPEAERDTDLSAKLKSEASGILNRLIAGCLSWRNNGLVEPQEVKEATAEYREESDPIAQFIDDRCLIAANGWTLSANLYMAYHSHAKNAGDYPLNEKAFASLLSKRGLAPVRKNAGRGWSGITLRSQAEVGNQSGEDDDAWKI
jgi:putative DNA primase/helicase